MHMDKSRPCRPKTRDLYCLRSRLEPQSNPRLRDLRIGCEDKGIAIRADIHRRA